jgi:hypothetical protein
MSERLDTAKAWLRAKNTMIWGYKGWDLTDEEELTEAAEYWLSEHDSYIEFVNGEEWDLLDTPKITIDMNALKKPAPAWPAPTIEQHEIALWETDRIRMFGPPIAGCPGSGPDEIWDSISDNYDRETA